MTRAILGFFHFLNTIRVWPHVVLMLASPNRAIIEDELARWAEPCMGHRPEASAASRLLWMMTMYPEYRALFYYRIGGIHRLVAFLCPPMQTLLIATGSIGPRFFIQHGFSTIITAESIGADCWVNQQVTIGFKAGGGRPTIGDRVIINAGAKVLGGITIGSDVVIGANAVVVKDVPSNVTVVGVPAYIVRRDGVRVNEKL
jgi:serine O-acetyltransferase